MSFFFQVYFLHKNSLLTRNAMNEIVNETKKPKKKQLKSIPHGKRAGQKKGRAVVCTPLLLKTADT